MDKKDVVIVILGFSLGALTREYIDLVHDFKLLLNKQQEIEEVYQKAKTALTNHEFVTMIENFDEE